MGGSARCCLPLAAPSFGVLILLADRPTGVADRVQARPENAEEDGEADSLGLDAIDAFKFQPLTTVGFLFLGDTRGHAGQWRRPSTKESPQTFGEAREQWTTAPKAEFQNLDVHHPQRCDVAKLVDVERTQMALVGSASAEVGIRRMRVTMSAIFRGMRRGLKQAALAPTSLLALSARRRWTVAMESGREGAFRVAPVGDEELERWRVAALDSTFDPAKPGGTISTDKLSPTGPQAKS
jgi:hypothetical protein